MREGWRSNPPLGAMVSAAFSPRPRHHRVRRGASWLVPSDRHPPAERAFAPGIEAEDRNAEGGSVHESPARGACPTRVPISMGDSGSEAEFQTDEVLSATERN